MNNCNFLDFFKESPIPCSFHEIIFNEKQEPVDYYFSGVNEAFERFIPLPKEALIGKSYLSTANVNNHFNNEWYQNFRKAVNQKEVKTCNCFLPINHSWVKATIFPIDCHHFGCFYEDITKTMKEEELLKGLIDVNLDLLVVSDMDGHFIKTNDYFENLVGANFADLTTRTFFEFMHEEDISSTREVMKNLLKGEEINNFVNRYKDKNGQYHFLEWRAKQFGRFIYASARDITKTVELANRLEFEMTIDNLTGLYNRHFFHKITNETMEKANNTALPLSMIIADIDHFKFVNDTWGHPVGDDILVSFSQLLKSSIRKTDYLSRLGGEEFVIVLPDTKVEDAVKVADKIRIAVAGFRFPIISKLTASFGVAQMIPNESLRSWYKRTDDAMYCAKEQGRNRVASSSESLSMESLSTSPYFEWHNEWSSGNVDIDNQHREIIELGNNLIFMFQTNVPYEKIINQIEKIIKHISQHFYFEEKVMYNLDYPNYDEHCALHRDIILKANDMKKKYQNGEIKSIVLASFLVDNFIVGHMAEADTKYFYLTKQND
ncbi:MAG: diguanylate cyclase [Bacilli bacterium]